MAKNFQGLSVRDAIETILNSISPLANHTLLLEDAAGDVLAEDVRAVDDVPFTDNSAMDGFAVRTSDLEDASPAHPVALRIVGMIAAGRVTATTGVAHGTTLRIMTGATIPAGADAVIPLEHVRVEGQQGHLETAFFDEPVGKGDCIRPAGEDMRAGEIVLHKGTVLSPAALAVAVAAGRRELLVVKRPIVAIFTSGDELIGPGQPLEPGLVRNSNSIALAAHLSAAGCDVVDLGIARDDRIEIQEGLETAKRADLLITSGGVSMGEKDLMRAVLEEQGLKTKFWRLNMKPGRPVLFGILAGIPVFGLPGNPVSTQVTFELLVRPALRKMMGHRRLFRPVVPVIMSWDAKHAPGRTEFIRVKLRRVGGAYIAEPTTVSQSSGIVTSLLDADGLLILDEDTVLIPEGAEARCVLLSGKEEESGL